MSALSPPELWGVTANHRPLDGVREAVLEAFSNGMSRVVLREVDRPWSAQLELAQDLLVAGVAPERLLLRVQSPDELADANQLGTGVHLADRAWDPSATATFVSRSLHRLSDLPAVSASGVHCVVVSPIAPARSKSSSQPPLGIDGLRRFLAASPLPVIALGGLHPSLAAACIRAGAAGVAAITAVFGPAPSERTALLKAIHTAADMR